MIRAIAVASVIFFTAALVVGRIEGTGAAQVASLPRPQNTVLNQTEVQQLLLLIAGNKAGKITKEEWMKFMAAEFDRLDKNKSGVLEAKELAQSRLRVSRLSNPGPQPSVHHFSN